MISYPLQIKSYFGKYLTRRVLTKQKNKILENRGHKHSLPQIETMLFKNSFLNRYFTTFGVLHF